MPLVSVCIPTFNNAAMVGDAVRSAMAQTYDHLEILVLDNASSDETTSVVSSVSGDDPRVRYLRHPANLGMAGNFNAALGAALGDFILILCADDVLEPDGIERLAAGLDAEPGAVLSAGARTVVNASMKATGRLEPRSTRELVSGSVLLAECFVNGNVIGEPSAVLLRRAAAQRGFDPAYHQFIDLEMWMHLLGRGSAVLMPEPVARIRRHEGQWSEANVRNGRLVRDKQAFFRLWAPQLESSLRLRDKLTWDARMCSSAALTRAAGASVSAPAIAEVFFPALFRFALAVASFSRPLARAARRLAAKRLQRSRASH